MIELLISILGIPIGYILGLIAPEELEEYQKHVTIIKTTLYLILLITILTLQWSNLTVFIIFLLLGILLFVIHQKYSSLLLEIPIYLFFIVTQLYSFHLLPTVLLFLYGIPLGITIKHEKEKKS